MAAGNLPHTTPQNSAVWAGGLQPAAGRENKSDTKQDEVFLGCIIKHVSPHAPEDSLQAA